MFLLVDDVVPICFIYSHILILSGALVSVGVQVDGELVDGGHLAAGVRVACVVVQDRELLGVKWVQLYLGIVNRILERHGVADLWLVFPVAIVKMVILQGNLKDVLIDVQGRILALFLHIEAAPTIIHDDRDGELISARAQNLLEVLSSVDIQLNWAKFSNCFSIEVWIEWLGFDSDLTSEVLRRQLINIAGNLWDLLASVPGESIPSAFDRDLDSRVVWFLSFSIQDRSLEKRSLDGIFR